MPISTFPSPKKDPRFSFPNRFGIPDNVYQGIVKTSDFQISSGTQLTDAANIDSDASLGVNFYVTLGGNRNMNAPTNAYDWKVVRYYINQDAVGGRTLTWDSAFRFSTDIPSPTLTVTAYFSDYVEFMYNPTYTRWDCLRVIKGFDSTPL